MATPISEFIEQMLGAMQIQLQRRQVEQQELNSMSERGAQAIGLAAQIEDPQQRMAFSQAAVASGLVPQDLSGVLAAITPSLDTQVAGATARGQQPGAETLDALTAYARLAGTDPFSGAISIAGAAMGPEAATQAARVQTQLAPSANAELGAQVQREELAKDESQFQRSLAQRGHEFNMSYGQQERQMALQGSQFEKNWLLQLGVGPLALQSELQAERRMLESQLERTEDPHEARRLAEQISDMGRTEDFLESMMVGADGQGGPQMYIDELFDLEEQRRQLLNDLQTANQQGATAAVKEEFNRALARNAAQMGMLRAPATEALRMQMQSAQTPEERAAAAAALERLGAMAPQQYETRDLGSWFQWLTGFAR